MPAYKDTARNTWTVKFQYKNWKGERKWVTKRGFKTKRDAAQWENEFKMMKKGSLEMTFANFVSLYREDVTPRLKVSTQLLKDNIIDSKLLPYFGRKPIQEITSHDVMLWQNELLQFRDPKTGKPYSKSYLKTIHNHLSAIFNHAVRHYKLKENPAMLAGSMGTEKGGEMLYWTREEYLQFSEAMEAEPLAHCCFQILYWCGIREGELLALTPSDIDLQTGKLKISKTYQYLKGKELITEPKTHKSNRTIQMPAFLVDELKEYMKRIYDLQPDARLFPVKKSFLYRMMSKGAEAAGVKKIRIHDLRHSHVSLLIHMGYSAVAIADRIGHESVDITYRYAHLFPSVQTDMANRLNQLMAEGACA